MPTPGPALECPGSPSDTGAFRLSWTATGDVSLYEGGELLYTGSHDATTVTGRPAGTYDYELVDASGTARCQVEVAPPSLAFAGSLLAAGLVVFVATVALVVAGDRAHRRGAGA